MNVTIKTLIMLTGISAGVLVTSCSEDDATVKEFTATMEEYAEQDGKTVLYNGFLYWQQGDQIKVYGSGGSYGVYTGNNAGGVTTFSLTSGDPGSGSYVAIYPASAGNDDGTIELPAVQMSNDGSLTGFPMYATSDNSDLNFMHLCGVLRLRLQKQGVSVSAIEITSDVELTGRYSITMSRNGVPMLTYVSYGEGDPHKSAMLVSNTPQSISSSKDFYIYLPEHDYTSLRIRIYSSDGGVCTKTLNSGVTIDIRRGSIKTITMSSSLSFIPNAGRLNGLFSVSPTKQVYFSQGNLRYQASTGTWCFAPNQYNYVGSANSNISNTYSGWIDLFGWGTGSNPTLASTDGTDYSTFVDWGSNAITNGGNTDNNGWRTLTSTELDYLFNTRANATNLGTANARYTKGMVNNIHGVILFPDGYTHPTGITIPTGINVTDNTGWNSNSYTLAHWKAMEAAGAVFLPAAGYRFVVHATNVFEVGSYGYYWSSSPFDEYNAYYMNFYSHDLYAASGNNRVGGFAVRPVRDNN